MNTTESNPCKQVEICAEVSEETARKLKDLADAKGVSLECLVAELVESEVGLS